MRLLVLGGTRFLGRHLVDAALVRGHDVTVFTRGLTASPWDGAVTHLVGNRDPRIAPGLAALGSGEWDAAIDTSGYVPRCVRAGAELLADRVAHYAFVSSLSVYADATDPGLTESAPVATLDDPAPRTSRRTTGRSRRAARTRSAPCSRTALSSCAPA